MAIAYLEEYKTLSMDSNGNILPVYPMPDAAQTLTITGTSALFTNPLNEETKFIRIWADTACYFTVGDGTPVASAATPSLPGSVAEARAVVVGTATTKVAARTIAI